jgi:hypothetical protein
VIWRVATVAPSWHYRGDADLAARVIVRGRARSSPSETGEGGQVSLAHLLVANPQAFLG